jgi:hypothetical protein
VFLGWSTSSPLSTKGFDIESKSVSNNVRSATLKVALTSYSPEIPLEHPNIPEFNREREREKREKERECGAVGATSTPSTVGLFSFVTMLFLPTFYQH